MIQCAGGLATVRSIQRADRVAQRIERLLVKAQERDESRAAKLAALQVKNEERKQARLDRTSQNGPPGAKGSIDKAQGKGKNVCPEGEECPDDKGKPSDKGGGQGGFNRAMLGRIDLLRGTLQRGSVVGLFHGYQASSCLSLASVPSAIFLAVTQPPPNVPSGNTGTIIHQDFAPLALDSWPKP